MSDWHVYLELVGDPSSEQVDHLMDSLVAFGACLWVRPRLWSVALTAQAADPLEAVKRATAALEEAMGPDADEIVRATVEQPGAAELVRAVRASRVQRDTCATVTHQNTT